VKPTRIAIEDVRFYLRNVCARLPFRYGKATLVAMPLLHVRLSAVSEQGRRTEGYSADCLPPKWFDKEPSKDYHTNIEDLLSAIRIAERVYRTSASRPGDVFKQWMQAYPEVTTQCKSAGLNGLTASFGSSLMERALLDAGSKAAGLGYRQWILSGGSGLAPGEVHPELKGIPVDSLEQEAGSGILRVRHTIGLVDSIWTHEIPSSERLNDGLPQSVEEWIQESGVRMFKIKVSGDLEVDRARLGSIAHLLDGSLADQYGVTLDGNEVFPSFEALEEWYGTLQKEPGLQHFWSRVLVLEQPIERHRALESGGREVLNRLQKDFIVIIDESDDSVDSFKQAQALGYRGVSVKNCKGTIKGILNRLLVKRLDESSQGIRYELTAEDLCNLPVVPLQQDLAQIDLLGVPHAERNGHHFFHGLDHLTPPERSDCLSRHALLYESMGASGKLRIRDGEIHLTSLRQEGFGACGKPDFESMVPLADWGFESLSL
jgi:hypothetical protein